VRLIAMAMIAGRDEDRKRSLDLVIAPIAFHMLIPIISLSRGRKIIGMDEIIKEIDCISCAHTRVAKS
jgi:hypothetical protein